MSDANKASEYLYCPECEIRFLVDAEGIGETLVYYCPFCGRNTVGKRREPMGRTLSDADIEAIYQRFAAAEAFTVRRHDGRAADWE